MDKRNGIRNNGGADDYSHMQFNNQDRKLLTKLMMMPESQEAKLNDVSIAEWFKDSPHIFTTNFWYMWETTFAFKKESSAMELRRYMNRMILEFSRINTLEGVTRTPYNQYESIILPMRKYLSDHGVTFINNRKITAFQFKDTPLRDDIIVTGLEYEDVGENKQTAQSRLTKMTSFSISTARLPIVHRLVISTPQLRKIWNTLLAQHYGNKLPNISII